MSDGHQALTFDGVNDYISVPNAGEFASGESFTASAWIKVTALPPSASSICVKGYGTAGQTMPWWMLVVDGLGAVGLWMRNLAGSTVSTVGGDISGGGWHLVTGVYNSTTATSTTYIDGVSAFTVSSVAAGAYGTNTQNLEIGGTILDRWWAGSIADARIYSRALSPQEIRLLAKRPGIAYELAPRKFYSLPAASSRQYRLFRPSILRGA